MAAEVNDLNIIQDEDTLRRMWQQTEDFSRKKEIRMRMYKLREDRLKSYYITKEMSSDGEVIMDRKPKSLTSHAQSLSDQGFITMKTKEIRDSASPPLNLKQICSTDDQQRTESRQSMHSQQMVTSRTSNSSNLHNRARINEISTRYESTPQVENTSALISYNSENNTKNAGYSTNLQYHTTSSSSAHQKISSSHDTNHETSSTMHTESNSYREVPVENSTTEHKTSLREEHFILPVQNNISKEHKVSIEKERYTVPLENASTERNISVRKEHYTVPTENTSNEYHVSTRKEHYTVPTENTSTEHSVRTRTETRSTVDESQNNVNHSIMNELHKLDKYLSTEAGESPSKIDERKDTRVSRSQTIEEQSHSKISVDCSATHNAFASSLRASPDRSGSSSPGKRSPIKRSLERISPDKTTRASPEKSINFSSNDLSRKYTTSFQNRVTSSRKNSQSPSPTKKMMRASSTSEYDSDESSVSYNRRTNSKVEKQSTNKYVHSSQHKEERIHKSTESSPERSAFKPVSSSTSSLSKNVSETTNCRQPQTKLLHEKSTTEKKTSVNKERINRNLPNVSSYPAATNNKMQSKKTTMASNYNSISESKTNTEKNSMFSKPTTAKANSPERKSPTKSDQLSQNVTKHTTKTTTETSKCTSPDRSPQRSNKDTIGSLKTSTMDISFKSVKSSHSPTKDNFPETPVSPSVNESPDKLSQSPTYKNYRSPEMTATSFKPVQSFSSQTKDDVDFTKTTSISSVCQLPQSPTKDAVGSPKTSTCSGPAKSVHNPTTDAGISSNSITTLHLKLSPTCTTSSPYKSPDQPCQNAVKSTVPSPKLNTTNKNCASPPKSKSPIRNEHLKDITEDDKLEKNDTKPQKTASDTTTAVPTQQKYLQKKRSASCKEISREKKSVKKVEDESTSESSDTTSISSESECEREEIIIEEILDEDLAVPSISRQTSRDQRSNAAPGKVLDDKVKANLVEIKPQKPVQKSVQPDLNNEGKVFKEETQVETDEEIVPSKLDENFKEHVSEKELEISDSKKFDKVSKQESLKITKPVLKNPNDTEEGIPHKTDKFHKPELIKTPVQNDQGVSESRKPNLSEIDQQISTDEEIQKMNSSVKTDIIKNKTKSTSDVLKKKKIFQEGEFGGSVPSIEKILGSSEIRAINDDFIKRERKFINMLLQNENRNKITSKKINQTPLKGTLKTPAKKNVTKEMTKRSNSENIQRKVTSEVQVTPKTNRTTSQKSLPKTTTRIESQKNLINRLHSDRSLKEKNEKFAERRLNTENKTKSETALQRSKPTAPTDKRQVPNRIQPVPQKSNKENEVKRVIKTSTRTDSSRSLKEITQKPKEAVPKKTPLKSTISPMRKPSRESIKSPAKSVPKAPVVINARKNTKSSSSSSSSSSLIDLNSVPEIETHLIHEKLNSPLTNSVQPHLNVVVQLPSPSCETTPNKHTEDGPIPLDCDEDGIPRYADRVVEPDDVEVITKLKLNKLHIERITDLDEEESGEAINVSVADRRTKFLENAKDSSIKTTFENENVFHNREQDVSRTKEMFETIARSQKPVRAPPILSRPSIFEHRRLRETIEEEENEGHDGEHKVVSKKLNDNDYEEYLKERKTNEHECDKITVNQETGHDKIIFEENIEIAVTQPKTFKETTDVLKHQSSESVEPASTIKETQSVSVNTSSEVIKEEIETCDEKLHSQSIHNSSTTLLPTEDTVTHTSFTIVTKKLHKPVALPQDKPIRSSVSKSRETSPIKSPVKESPRSPVQKTIDRYEHRQPISSKTPLKPKPIEVTAVEIKPNKQVFTHTAITNVPLRKSEIEECSQTETVRTKNVSKARSENSPNLTNTKRSSGEKSPSPSKTRDAPRNETLQTSEIKQECSFTSVETRNVSKPRTEKSPSPTRTSKSRNEKSPSPTRTSQPCGKSPSPTRTSKPRNEKSPSPTRTSQPCGKSPSPTRTSKPRNEKSPSPTRTSQPCGKSPSPSRSSTSRENSPSKSTSKTSKQEHFSLNCEIETKKKPFEKRLSTTGGDYENRKKFFETKSQNDLTTKSTKASEARVASTATHIREERRSSQQEQILKTRRISQESKKIEVQNSHKSPEKTTTKKSPFGVVLRRTSSKSDTPLTEKSITIEINEEERKIEEIFDLQLLEKMLETAVQYDIRSRIRAQIRLIKRQQQTKKTSRTPSPEKSVSKDNKMTSSNQLSASTTTTSESRRTVISSTPDHRDKVKKRLFSDVGDSAEKKSSTTKNTTTKHARTHSHTKLSAIENCSEGTTTYRTDFGGDMKSATTDARISSYGIGPTRAGKPLFGLEALRASRDTNEIVDDGDITFSKRTEERKVDEVTDKSGKALFGLKALQQGSRRSHKSGQCEDEYDSSHLTTFNERRSNITSGDKSNDYCTRTSTSESNSTMFSSRTAMKSDSSGNVIVVRDEVKGEIRSKDGKEPTGRMVTTRYSYQKPENGEPTITTKTTTRLLNADDQKIEGTQHRAITNRSNESSTTISDNDSNWKTKFSSPSLIRKISNERFQKAHRKFSGSDETTLNEASNEVRNSIESRMERSSSSRRSYSTVESGTEDTRTSANHDSSKDGKSNLQQATVSSSLKRVNKTCSEESEEPSYFRNESKSFSAEASCRSETRISNGRTMTSSFSSQSFSEQESGSRSEYTDDEKETATTQNKFTSGSVSLRDLTHSSGSTTMKSAVLTQKKQSEVDIEEIRDEKQLRNLLETCTDYESRRLIRAKLRTIMAENKASIDILSATDGVDVTQTNETSDANSVTPDRKNDGFSSCTKEVHSRTTTVTGRLQKANSVASPFFKFRQLERQNSLPSTGPHPIPTHNNYTNPHLSRSASSIKERMLNWVKAQTKEYENIQIDNFSTSWNNGLAFCALIHHFCPYAFDYNKLTPDQRRYNFELAFRVAEEEAGIMPLLDVEDMIIMKRPDWKCVFTYVQTFYQRFHATPQAVRTE